MRWPKLQLKNKKTSIFLICLGISAFLWLLIKLSKEYEISIHLPVEYSNFPKDKILVNKPDSLLLLKLSDHGFDLIPYSIFGTFKELDIDVSKQEMRKSSSGIYSYYTLTPLLSEKVNGMISSAKFVSIIRPDSLVVKMENLEHKKVKIIPKVEYSLESQHQLKTAIYLQPDSVTLFGSKNLLRSLDSVVTETIQLSNLNKSIVEEIDLQIPAFVNCKTEITNLNIEVEKFTESSISIPLKTHFISEQDFRIFPSKVNIKYAVSFEKFKEVNASDFHINIEKDSLINGRLYINLNKYPEYVRVIDYSPKIAEYITIKN